MKVSRRTYSKNEINEMISLYVSGMSLYKIREILKMDKSNIKEILIQNKEKLKERIVIINTTLLPKMGAYKIK